MHCRRILLSLVVVLGVSCMIGCAKNGSRAEETVDLYKAGFARFGQTGSFRVEKDAPCVRARRIPYTADETTSLLDTPVTLYTHATLQEICAMIKELVPVAIDIVPDTREDSAGQRRSKTESLSQSQSANSSFADLPEIASYLTEERTRVRDSRISIHHEGPLVRLLESVAAATGMGFDFDASKNTITFARQMVKTFLLATAPGEVAIASQLTNKSRESQTGSGNGRIRATQTTSDVKAEIAQVYQDKLRFDVWEDTLRNVKSMLSPEGRAEGNQGAGTITVRDHPGNLRQIGRYIDCVNERCSLQVALKVNVYSLEVTDERTKGLDLLAILPKLHLAGTAVALQGGTAVQTALGSAQATILNGTFKGSQAFLQALKTIGRARQITSAGIVALNNQPAPVEAIKRIAYLAGTSVDVTENGSETGLTPGEVTTGFSMTITPHILDRKKVVLQYNVHLATLDALESFETNNVTIQLPRVSSRAFSQKASMLMGQTLLVSGFQQANESEKKSMSLFSLGKTQTDEKSFILITIEVNDATPVYGF